MQLQLIATVVRVTKISIPKRVVLDEIGRIHLLQLEVVLDLLLEDCCLHVIVIVGVIAAEVARMHTPEHELLLAVALCERALHELVPGELRVAGDGRRDERAELGPTLAFRRHVVGDVNQMPHVALPHALRLRLFLLIVVPSLQYPAQQPALDDQL